MKALSKLAKFLPALLIAVTLLTGCDFFRSLVGKPTSKDIERMKQEAAEKARKQRELDSINRAKAIELENARRLEAANAGLLDESEGRFHVVIGSFKLEGNASNFLERLEKDGYTPRKFKFNNGFDVVSAGVYDNYREARKAMYDILEYEKCPEDVWIYDINQNLHVKRTNI